MSTSIASPTYYEIAANGAFALINMACTLLDLQVAFQSAAFEQKGGLTERLYTQRTTKLQP